MPSVGPVSAALAALLMIGAIFALAHPDESVSSRSRSARSGLAVLAHAAPAVAVDQEVEIEDVRVMREGRVHKMSSHA